jgi:hypothetical protein
MRTVNFLLIVAIVTVTAPYAWAQCTPPGEQIIGGGGGVQYDWIANGYPNGSTCWLSNAPVITTTDCGSSRPTFDFNNANDSVTQYPEIPSYDDVPVTRFDLTYLLTKIDPNHSSSGTKLKAEVLDANTNTVIASHTYRGDDPDITCVRRDLTFTFIAPSTGADFRVRFTGGSTFPNATIRVRSIALLQY